MKRVLFILALGVLLTSCKFIAENFYSVEDCVEWYCDKMYDAAADRDSEAFASLSHDFLSWRALLEESDKIEADEAYLEWGEDNEVKAGIINDYAYALDL